MLDWSGFSVVDLLPFIAAGFAAQLVDGALGMAFGIISSTLLISLGVSPAAASAGVHFVETFTTGVSGISHAVQRNVDWKLFARLAIPGVIGGVIGAYGLTRIDGSVTRPFVLAYIACIGAYLIWRSFRFPPTHKAPRVVEPLGFIGGFLDAAGGGGWGPVVTSNLLVQGGEPRRTIGTVNTTEFVLTLSISTAFIVTMGWAAFTKATVGLLIGGVAAAPLGAIVTRKASPKSLLWLVGCLLIVTSAVGIYDAVTAR